MKVNTGITAKGVALVFVLSAGQAWAEGAVSSAKCVPGQQVVQDIQVGETSFSDGSCAISIFPANLDDVTYRNFIIDDQGLFMVFDSVPGDENVSTGARSYFFFPRNGIPTYEFLSDGRLQVTSSSGQLYYFSPKTGDIDSIPGVDYKEDPTISMANNGGLEITRASGVWLDTGWKLGEASYQVPTGHSTFYSGNSKGCVVTNSEVFTYTNDAPVFKFAKDQDLAVFLKSRCPDLDLSSLNN